MTARGGCGSVETPSGLAISFTRAIATAYSTSPTTKPTRFLEGSWRWRAGGMSGCLEDGAEIEQDQGGASAVGRTADSGDVGGLLATEDVGWLDLVARQAPDLLHLV